MTRSRVKNDFAVGLTTDSIGRLTTDHTITSGGSIVVGNDGSVTGAEGAQIDLRGTDGTTSVYYFDVAGTPEVGRIFTVTDDTDLQIGQLGGTGGDVQFYAGGSRKARFDSDGLKFNNDTSVENALADYEEGTFTPTLTTSNGDLSATYTVSGAYYRKIGKAVYFQVYFQTIVVTNAGTGTPRMGNLPYYARGGAHHTPCSFSYENAFTVDAGGYVQSGQNFVQIMQTTSNSANSFVVQSSGRVFMISGFYFTP
jgi:hypothetical protein